MGWPRGWWGQGLSSGILEGTTFWGVVYATRVPVREDHGVNALATGAHGGDPDLRVKALPLDSRR